MAITLEQLTHSPLRSVVVWLERFGGTVTLQELTGEQILLASQWAAEAVPGASGLRQQNEPKQKRVLMALALTEPSFGDTDALKAARSDELKGLGAIDQLLLLTVIERLNDGILSEDDREALASHVGPAEHLDALGVGHSPTAVVEAASDEELQALLRVSLAVPDCLFGKVPMSVIKLLAEAQRGMADEQARLVAGHLALAMAGGA